MIASLIWGAVAAVSLVVGSVLAMLRRWAPRPIGIVLGFGAGALMASIAFELWEQGYDAGGAIPLVIGLAVGAMSYFLANRLVTRVAARAGTAAGVPLAVGALLDGIPEQLVLGIGLAAGEGVSVALIVAIFVSNLPESIGSSADMLGARSARRSVLLLWVGVAVLCMLATVAGFLVADNTGGAFQAGASGFAAGALLVMLVDSMVPEAQEKAKDLTGLATVIGFTVAAGLSLLG